MALSAVWRKMGLPTPGHDAADRRSTQYVFIYMLRIGVLDSGIGDSPQSGNPRSTTRPGEREVVPLLFRAKPKPCNCSSFIVHSSSIALISIVLF